MKNAFRKALVVLEVGLFFVLGQSAFALASGGVGALPAYADPNVRFSDSWFIYNLDINESKEDGVLVFNRTDEVQDIKIYAVDAVSSNQGNFALERETDPRDEIGSWIELEETLITLEPGEERVIPFTITIPETADVGEHAGGIVVQKAAPGDAGGSGGASLLTRIGVRVYETVPGEIIRKLAVNKFSVTEMPADSNHETPYYRIELGVSNDSNVSIKPLTKLTINGWGMTEYFERSKAEGGFFLSDFTNFFQGEELEPFEWQLFKGADVSTSWEWPVPAFGEYTFQVEMMFDDNGTERTITTDPVTVSRIPWGPVIGIGGVVLLLVLLILLKVLLGGKRRWKTYTVRPGDQLFEIAAIGGVKWKKLMKANKLGLPKLKPGQVIKVPKKFLKQVSILHDEDEVTQQERPRPKKKTSGPKVTRVTVVDADAAPKKKPKRKKAPTTKTKKASTSKKKTSTKKRSTKK